MANEFKLSYTASQINEKLGEIENLAKKSEIPSKLSQLTNDSGFATENYVNSAIENIDFPETDLSGYALKSEIPTDYLTEIPAEYVTEAELTAKGYLTEHQSLAGLATETFVNEGLATKQPIGDYALKSDIPTDYLKAVPAEYVTEYELNSKGYLTEQSLDGLATETFVTEQISTKADSEHDHSWESIEDKPFYEGTVLGDTLTWNGNTEGLVATNKISELGGITYYKISDITPLLSEMLNRQATAHLSHGSQVTIYFWSSPAWLGDGSQMTLANTVTSDSDVVCYGQLQCLICLKAPVTLAELNLTLDEPGVYMPIFNDGTYTCKMTIPGFSGFPTTVDMINESSIPSTIARVSDIPEIPEIPEVPAVLDENGKLLNSVLPDGYPYAEYEFKPITWDGNTEGLVSAGNLYKVSELPENLPADYDFTDANNSPIVFDSVTYRENSRSPIQNGAGVIFVFPNNKMTFGVAFALEAGSKLSVSDPIPFPEPGVYFYKSDDGKFVSWFAGAESIHKLRKEFTPEIPTYAFVEFNGLITPHGVETEDQLHNMVHEFANNDVHIMYSNADFSSVPFEEYMPCVNAMLTYNDGSVTLMFVNSSNQVKLKLTPTYDEDSNYTGFTIDKEVLNTGGASKTLNLYACYRDMADDGRAERVPALTPDNILDWGGTSYDDCVSITDLVDVEHVVIFEGQTDVGVSATVEYYRDNYGHDYATFTFYSEHEERIRIMSSREFEGTTTPVATEEYVDKAIDDAIANLDIPSSSPDLTGLATEDFVTQQIANLVNSAPDALNTLDELAAALGDDENFATTVTNQIATKADAEHTHDYNDLENKTHYIDKELRLIDSGENTVTGQIYVEFGYPDVIVCTCDGVEYTLNKKWVGGTGYWGYDEFQAGTSPVYFESNATGDAQSINVVDDGKAHEVVYSTYYATNVYVPLDEHFIPDTIARVSDIAAPRNELILNSSTEGSTKQFKITIDDTGTLTVSEIV